MKNIGRKIIEIMFLISFVLTGCGIDSIFEGAKQVATWAVIALVMIACAWVLGGFVDD